MIQLTIWVEFVESVAPPKLYHYNLLYFRYRIAGLADDKNLHRTRLGRNG